MQKKLFKNIKELVGILPADVQRKTKDELNKIETIQNAWLLTDGERIADFGTMQNCPEPDESTEIIDASGRLLMPTFVDSHTHIVFAGTRQDEYEMRLNGATYEEIAAQGGGILNSTNKLQATSEDELYDAAKKRLDEVISMGTGAIEIKSGYGLTIESELKMLRVIKRLKENSDAEIKATFLGAHAVPKSYQGDADKYIDDLIEKALPEIAKENLADYIDIFCEKGYFTVAHTDKILKAGEKYGLKPKIHVNQFNAIGGIEAGIKHNAISVDHLEVMDESDFEHLKTSNTIATLLPLCSYFINIPYGPAKKMNNSGITIALATDFNPGSTPCGNMQLVQSMACVNMKLTPVEAFNASTINAAAAIESASQMGSITKGKKANLILTKPIPSLSFITYNFGHNHVESVFLASKQQ